MKTPAITTPFVLACIADADLVDIGPDGDDDPEPEPPAPAAALVERWREVAPACTACVSRAVLAA